MIKISNVRIFLSGNPDSPTKAMATVLLNKKLLIQSIRIAEVSDDSGNSVMRVFYPNQRLPGNTIRRCVSASADFRGELDDAILCAYEQVKGGADNTVVFSDEEGDFDVTAINVYPISSEGDTPNPLLAKVAVQFDSKLWLRGMILVEQDNGARLLRSPNRRTQDNRRISFFQFVDRSVRDALRDSVISAYDSQEHDSEDG